MSLALSLAGVVLSVIAVLTSTLLLVRQTSFMRHANELPISIDLYQEYRSSDFQRSQYYVLNSLSTSVDPKLGFSNIEDDEARIACNKVATFFSSLGALVCLGLVDERFVVSLLGSAIHRVWNVLEPYILHERVTRDDNEIFVFFEDLEWRTRKNYMLAESYDIKFHRVPYKYQLSDTKDGRTG